MKVYTSEEVADLLSVGAETVRRWARTGKLKGAHLGRAGWRFTEDDLQNLLDAHRTQRPKKMRDAETTP